MNYVKKFENFNVNETLDMFTLPVDPIPGSEDVLSDISQWFSETGEFIWNKINEFIDWCNKILNKENLKEYFSKLFEAIGELSKIQLNRASNLFFSKDYHDVEWNDINLDNVKNLYSKISNSVKDFTTDKSWSFKDDENKLQSKEGLDDKSLQLKKVINQIIGFLGKSAISVIISKIVSASLIALGVTTAPIVSTITSILILILFIWASKKKVSLEVKVMKDVRDVPGYQPKGLIGRITGWSEFAEKKVKEYQDFTQGDSPFQKLYFQKLKEQSEKIKSEQLSFS
jgi:hypothetical protein